MQTIGACLLALNGAADRVSRRLSGGGAAEGIES